MSCYFFLNSDIFLPLYKSILKKLKFKETVLDRVPKGISKFLGVHIRLTDFNFYHGDQYGHLTLGDYVACVKKILKEGNYDGLFVSSDNAESVPNMKQHLPDIDIIYNKSLTYGLIINSLFNELWCSIYLGQIDSKENFTRLSIMFQRSFGNFIVGAGYKIISRTEDDQVEIPIIKLTYKL